MTAHSSKFRVARAMSSLCTSISAAALMLGLAPAASAAGDELPLRKSGQWEVRMSVKLMTKPVIIIQCTDDDIERMLVRTSIPYSTSAISYAGDNCDALVVRKTDSGYETEAACKINGTNVTTLTVLTGDFNSAYTTKMNARGPGAPRGDLSAVTFESKYLGPCAPGDKPGDITMPGGLKVNLNDTGKRDPAK